MSFLLLYNCKQFCPLLNSPRRSFVYREIIEDIGIRPFLNFPADKGKNKTGINIPPYIVYQIFIDICKRLFLTKVVTYSSAEKQILVTVLIILHII